MRLVLGTLIGLDNHDALVQSTLQVPSIEERANGDQIETPLENEGSVDHGGYRRRPIELKEPIVDLPTLDSAVFSWLAGTPVSEDWGRCR